MYDLHRDLVYTVVEAVLANNLCKLEKTPSAAIIGVMATGNGKSAAFHVAASLGKGYTTITLPSFAVK